MAEENVAESAPAKKSSGMDPKVAALLAWLFAPLTSIIFLVLDDMKGDETIQFHSKQSLFFSIFQFVVMLIPWLGWCVGFLLWIVRIWAAIKAYNGEDVEFPLIADWARK